MSEELKCPCCGGPMQKYDDPYASTFVACNSDNDECMFVCDVNNFQRITAAMELAKAEVNLDVSSTKLLEDSAIQDGTVELENWSVSHQQIMKKFTVAKDRVLEVFK